MKLMKLSVRIPMGLTMADLLIGIIVFSKLRSQGGAFPTTAFIIWIIVSIILIGISVYSYLQSRKK